MLCCQPRFYCFFVVFIALFLDGCTTVTSNNQTQTIDINDLLSTLENQGLSSQTAILTFLDGKDISGGTAARAIKGNRDLAATILADFIANGEIKTSANQICAKHTSRTEQYTYLALALVANQQQQVVSQLRQAECFSEKLIVSAALEAGADPSHLLAAAAAGEFDYRITPLIRSASITLFNQSEDTSNQLYFREKSAEVWVEAYPLQWEPINEALSGSIVRLKGDTEYQVKIELIQFGQVVDERFLGFTTRPESPPINPDLVFNLSDIYAGIGQFDLRKLNINGADDGWAKIIGDVPVNAGLDADNAIHLGDSKYIVLENFVVKGGRLNGIYAKNAHHIWISGCDISQWGRIAGDMRDGVGFESTSSTSPINHDAGIYLQMSGVVTVEDCSIHQPNGKANHWGKGHPKGPVAMFIDARYPELELQGQYILRNNAFFGTNNSRFNDVIEGERNFYRNGAFVRDSAIYSNYFAFANDDVLEIDGGQSNVLVYDNWLTNGYSGISVAPNMLGPSYIFNNTIVDLSDERGRQWTAIKMGGVKSKPIGATNIFSNYIVTNRNGISGSSVNGDKTLWANAANNIIITRNSNKDVGYAVLDNQEFAGSSFTNNVFFNLKQQKPRYKALESNVQLHEYSLMPDIAKGFKDTSQVHTLPIDRTQIINNFSVEADALSQASDSVIRVGALMPEIK